jgi:hypothetical protein
MPYAAPSDILSWVASVKPVGFRDNTLWGFAYAAASQIAPTSAWTMSAFTQFQTDLWAWQKGTNYWDGDFVAGYVQATGVYPSKITLPAFDAWLRANGYMNAQGAKTGVYPTGGQGYPPGGAATLGASAPSTAAASGSAATPPSASSAASGGGGLLAWVQANPLEAAGIGVGAGLVLALILK